MRTEVMLEKHATDTAKLRTDTEHETNWACEMNYARDNNSREMETINESITRVWILRLMREIKNVRVAVDGGLIEFDELCFIIFCCDGFDLWVHATEILGDGKASIVY